MSAADKNWHLSGEYAENCSCVYLCPCIFTNSTAPSIPATEEAGDHCIAAMALNIQDGQFGDVSLSDLSFMLILKTGLVMSAGEWTTAIIIDDKASPAQREALEQITSGQAGGPLEMLLPLIKEFAGIHYGDIQFHLEENKRSVVVPGMIEIGVEGYLSRRQNSEPFYIDNVGHPVSSRLALGLATGSHVHVGGIDWDDDTGTNNGHFHSFSWSGAAKPTDYVLDRKAAS
ncbi:MAG: hypothetical protein DRQ97_06975 [Gammaproteobacteria bacterium]|nr:MAG: hypothetical protein DRQ97_06975 [Gammaproteobacteria bacterium]